MKYSDEFRNKITDNGLITYQRESFDNVCIKLVTQTIVKQWKSNLIEWAYKLGEFDCGRIFISVDGVAIGTYDLRKLIEETDVEEDLESYINSDVEYTFELRITKIAHNMVISIYSISEFFEFLRTLSIQDLCQKLDELQMWRFLLLFETGKLKTDRIEINTQFSEEIQQLRDKKKLLEKKELLVSNSGIDLREVTPEDFYIQEIVGFEKERLLFDRVCLQLSYMYIANNIRSKGEQITCRFLGYKPVEINLEIQEINVDIGTLSNIYRVYEWVYGEGNVSDKGGITRNILSLYLEQSNYYNLKEDVYSYVQSCNELYIKENVQRYIEIKQNVIVIIRDLNQKFIELSDSFKGKISKNLLGLLSFFFTTIILNTIATGNVDNIFRGDIAMLSYAYLMISVVYLGLSLWDYFKCVKRYEELYSRQKQLYQDLLVKGDIEELFLNDKPFETDKKEIKWIAIKNTILWFIIVFVLMVTIKQLSGESICDFIAWFKKLS